MSRRNPDNGSCSRPSVAVVGAGLAGAVAAAALRERGCAVQVLESTSRVGGRLSGMRWRGFDFDMGAQYFTVRESATKAILAHWLTHNVAAPWQGRLGVINQAGRIQAKNDGEKRYVGVPDMARLARERLAGLRVLRAKQVLRLGKARAGLALQVRGEQRSRDYDAVVLATPPDVAANLLGEVLPDASRGLEPLNALASWCVCAAFETSLALEYDACFINTGQLRWAARNNSKPGRAMGESWVLHSNTAFCAYRPQAQAEQVIAQLTAEFAQVAGIELPKRLKSTAAFWPEARFEGAADLDAVARSELPLALCGDWCAGERVEGAMLSALNAAERIAECLRLSR